MNHNPKLSDFLVPYEPHIQDLTLIFKKIITDLVPEANTLIWDNYNAVAMAFSKSERLKDAFCHLAVYRCYVNFGFNKGTQLSKHSLKFEGGGKFIRHIKVNSFDSFPKKEVERLIIEAKELSESLNTDLLKMKGPAKSIVMSIAAKKRRPKSTN